MNKEILLRRYQWLEDWVTGCIRRLFSEGDCRRRRASDDEKHVLEVLIAEAEDENLKKSLEAAAKAYFNKTDSFFDVDEALEYVTSMKLVLLRIRMLKCELEASESRKKHDEFLKDIVATQDK